MTDLEKRKFIRWDALHLLDLVVLEEDGSEGLYSMGRTLDVSLNGLKLETTSELPVDAELKITVGIEDDLIDLTGRITNSSKLGGRYTCGIQFITMSDEGRKNFQAQNKIRTSRSLHGTR